MLLWAVCGLPCLAYFLGERPGDPEYLKCWAGGALLASCPTNLAIGLTWDLEDDSTLFTDEESQISYSMTYSSTGLVLQSSSHDVPHINVHACRAENILMICAPHIGTLTGQVVHSAAQFGTGASSGASTRILADTALLTLPKPGVWNVILHGRIFTSTPGCVTYAGTANCITPDANATHPIKIDAAIGGSVSVVDRPVDVNTEVQQQSVIAAVMRIAVALVIAFCLLFATWKIWKCATGTTESLDIETNTRREAWMELGTHTTRILLALTIVASQTWALATLATVMNETNSEVFTTCYAVLFFLSIAVTANTIRLRIGFATTAYETATGKFVTRKRVSQVTLDRYRRGSRTELMALFAGVLVDTPAIALNLLAYFTIVNSNAILMAASVSLVALGSKIASAEKLGMWSKMLNLQKLSNRRSKFLTGTEGTDDSSENAHKNEILPSDDVARLVGAESNDTEAEMLEKSPDSTETNSLLGEK